MTRQIVPVAAAMMIALALLWVLPRPSAECETSRSGVIGLFAPTLVCD